MRRLPASAVRKACLAVTTAFALLCPLRPIFGWGHEGHTVIALIAEHYMTPTALRSGLALEGPLPGQHLKQHRAARLAASR